MEDCGEVIYLLKDQIQTLNEETGNLISLYEQSVNGSGMSSDEVVDDHGNSTQESYSNKGIADSGPDAKAQLYLWKVYGQLLAMVSIATMSFFIARVLLGRIALNLITIVGSATAAGPIMLEFLKKALDKVGLGLTISTAGFFFVPGKFFFSLLRSSVFGFGYFISNIILLAASGVFSLTYIAALTMINIALFSIASLLGYFYPSSLITSKKTLRRVAITALILLPMRSIVGVFNLIYIVLFFLITNYDTKTTFERSKSGKEENHVLDSFNLFSDLTFSPIRILQIIFTGYSDKK